MSATDKNGQPVEDLSAANFTARLDGKATRIVSAKLNRDPRRIVLMLDESGSMGGGSAEWDLAVAATRYFAVNFHSQDAISYMAFADQPREVLPFGTPRQALVNELTRIASLRAPGRIVSGQTALWDSVLSAAGQFGKAQPGDAILVLTDGGDDSSKRSPRQVAKVLLSHRIRFFAFVVHGFVPSTLEFPNSPELLFGLSGPTGGAVIEPPKGWPDRSLPREPFSTPFYVARAWWAFALTHKFSILVPLLNSLGRQVEEFYEIDLSLPRGLANKGQLKPKLGLVKGPTTKHLKLAYPQKLAACGNPSQ